MDSEKRPVRFMCPKLSLLIGLVISLPLCRSGSTTAQTLSSLDRDRARGMLSVIKSDLKKNYYDAAIHGMDVDARFKAADEKMNQATSNGQLFSIIAQALIDLNDSHTFFIPPQRTSRTEYGWQMQMVGDQCYVTAIKPGSDADAKGLKVGDAVISIDRFTPDRDHLWILKYLYYSLRPAGGMGLVVQSPGAQPRRVEVLAKVVQGKKLTDLTDPNEWWPLIRESESESRLRRHRYYEMGDQLMIWKMPEFDLSQEKVDDMMNKARKYKALVLDLRGNPGGAETTLLRLVGDLFDHDVKVGDLKRRKEGKPIIAKTRGSHAFEGKVIVLVDHESGSAAELFARIVQIEKRGIVIGDRTAGAVMRSQIYNHQLGADTVIFYALSITDADIVMTDGKSLEHAGVTPDELLLPTAADLAAKRDPVLCRAAELAGVKMEPEKAGAMFPIEWRK